MIQFTYRLQGAGWADATISDGQTGASVPASYICDALGDFVAAAQSLFTTDTAECAWELEPGHIEWRFRRQGDRLKVEVLWFEEVRVAPDSFEYRLELDRVAFAGQCDVLDFAVQVDRALQELLDQWGMDRYQREWDYSFPVAARQRLQSHIAAEKRKRQAAGESNI
jgi:hypothetical protein